MTHARVVVQSPDRVNGFFTGLLAALFVGRSTYEVVRAVWPFATCGRGEAVEGEELCGPERGAVVEGVVAADQVRDRFEEAWVGHE